MTRLLLLLFFIAFILEAFVTTIPLVLDILLILYIINRKAWVFLAAFIIGLLLDISAVRVLGQSSIFFITLLFIATLYERKFEITSGYFVFFASFLGSLIYLLIFGFNHAFWQALANSTISLFIFKGINYFKKPKED